MKKVLTLDGSETYLNEAINETYHSNKGAVEEALKKYALPCRIKELSRTGKVTILDAFAGMGYNAAMAIDVALEENPDCEIEVIGMEIDPEIIANIQEVNPPFRCYSLFRQITPANLVVRKGKVIVKYILGDARETSKKLPENYFDAIFFDPFSPKSAPEVWTELLFKEMYRILKPTGILATFSCARMARDNMAAAGLFYEDGPIVGRRGPGTVASKWI